MTLKIEVGKEYVTRGGEVVRCASAIEPGTRGYENSAFWIHLPDGGCYVVTKDGDMDTPNRPNSLDIISEQHAAEPAHADEAQIVHMVERFLNWKLPENFNPDGGISFERFGNKGTPHEYRREPVGTNLFDYMQAEAMVRHMIEGLGEVVSQPPADEHETLRDKFAMAALTGLLAHASGEDPNKSPAMAYVIADAMVEARKK